MLSEKIRDRIIKILIVAGLFIAILSALEPHVEWLSALCGFLGDGCRDTELFVLFRIPVSIWGILFYIVLLLVVFFAGPSVFWPVLCGVGVELTLVRIMITQNFICVFCLLNFLIIISLFIFVINRNRIWQATALGLLFYVGSNALLLKVESYQKESGLRPNNSSVIAVVDGVEINEEDLMIPRIAGRVYKLERKIYNLKRMQLNDSIKSILINLEAKEKGINPGILKQQIFSNVKTVSDIEIEDYYQSNLKYYKSRKESLKQIKHKIRNSLQDRMMSDRMNEYILPLREKYGVVEYLTVPALPHVNIDVGNSLFQGPQNAALTIVEFSDYMCPSCRRAHKLIKELKEQYKGKIKWVFKDYPLKRHKGAKKMAIAARCAGEQGKFWEYQDLLFASDEKSDNLTLIKYAEKLGLNVSQFTKSLNSNKFLFDVEKDIRDANKYGVSSTPTFIINGKLNPGAPSPKQFKKMIDEALSK